ncbi:MAG: hypothetical protein ACLPY5_00690 [Candidatus Bathyarchaeia archaeon]
MPQVKELSEYRVVLGGPEPFFQVKERSSSAVKVVEKYALTLREV